MAGIQEGNDACPPEDCGGMRGYAEALQSINMSAHPQILIECDLCIKFFPAFLMTRITKAKYDELKTIAAKTKDETVTRISIK
jgi:hypothetical protein